MWTKKQKQLEFSKKPSTTGRVGDHGMKTQTNRPNCQFKLKRSIPAFRVRLSVIFNFIINQTVHDYYVLSSNFTILFNIIF